MSLLGLALLTIVVLGYWLLFSYLIIEDEVEMEHLKYIAHSKVKDFPTFIEYKKK